MSKTGIVGLGGALIVACLVGWLAGRGARDSVEPLPVALPDAAVLAIDAVDDHEVSRLSAMKPDRSDVPPPVASRPALPPIDMPFNHSVEALEEAAQNGDVVAACRLAAEALRCWNAHQMAMFLSSEERQIERMADSKLDAEQLERRIDGWMERKQVLENTMVSCEGVDVSVVQLARYDALAAAAGDPVARIRYLNATHLQPGVVIRHPEVLNQYRTNAYGYFMQALKAGDLQVLQSWQASVYFGELSALSSVLPESWQDPGFYNALIEQLTDTQRAATSLYDIPSTEPSPEQRAEAARVYTQYFAGAEPLEQHVMSQEAAVEAALLGMHEEGPERCQSLSH